MKKDIFYINPFHTHFAFTPLPLQQKAYSINILKETFEVKKLEKKRVLYRFFPKQSNITQYIIVQLYYDFCIAVFQAI